MYVCICKGITDKHIRNAVIDGASSYREVREQLGVASGCGQCACDAKAIVRETLNDIAASIAQLKRSGVVFEDYDFPGLKTVNHVCVLGAEKAAWFKDTEGNYLCIHEDLA